MNSPRLLSDYTKKVKERENLLNKKRKLETQIRLMEEDLNKKKQELFALSSQLNFNNQYIFNLEKEFENITKNNPENMNLS